MKLTKEQLATLELAKQQIMDLGDQQTKIYNSLIKRLGVKKDTKIDDCIFDYCFNDISLSILKRGIEAEDYNSYV